MKSIAQKIVGEHDSFADITNEAERIANAKIKYEKRAIFNFDDGSTLDACYPTITITSVVVTTLIKENSSKA